MAFKDTNETYVEGGGEFEDFPDGPCTVKGISYFEKYCPNGMPAYKLGKDGKVAIMMNLILENGEEGPAYRLTEESLAALMVAFGADPALLAGEGNDTRRLIIALDAINASNQTTTAHVYKNYVQRIDGMFPTDGHYRLVFADLTPRTQVGNDWVPTWKDRETFEGRDGRHFFLTFRVVGGAGGEETPFDGVEFTLFTNYGINKVVSYTYICNKCGTEYEVERAGYFDLDTETCPRCAGDEEVDPSEISFTLTQEGEPFLQFSQKPTAGGISKNGFKMRSLIQKLAPSLYEKLGDKDFDISDPLGVGGSSDNILPFIQGYALEDQTVILGLVGRNPKGYPSFEIIDATVVASRPVEEKLGPSALEDVWVFLDKLLDGAPIFVGNTERFTDEAKAICKEVVAPIWDELDLPKNKAGNRDFFTLDEAQLSKLVLHLTATLAVEEADTLDTQEESDAGF